MNRFLFDAGQDAAKVREAARVQFSQPHPPLLSDGTEVGLSHDESMFSRDAHGDAIARGMMPWEPERQDAELLASYRKLIRERRAFGHEGVAARTEERSEPVAAPAGVAETSG